MRVLVVEDDRSVRETLGMVLECYQYDVELVESGEAAIERIRSQWPDLLLLDLSLAGMCGEEVYAAIQRAFGRVPPTLVLSAVQHGELRVRDLPGVRFLPKPYTLDELLEAIRRMSSGAQPIANSA
jgi:two-component system OmpR family response regulator